MRGLFPTSDVTNVQLLNIGKIKYFGMHHGKDMNKKQWPSLMCWKINSFKYSNILGEILEER